VTALQVHDGVLQVFDVEHGACALLTVPAPDGGWKRMLIDCGHNATTKWYPGEHLLSLGVTHLDELAITNYDEDHLSGYPNLLQQGIGIDWILRNPTVAPQTIRRLKSETGMGPGIDALVASLANFAPPMPGSGGPPIFQGVQVEWFYNQYPYFQDENNLSLVLHLTIHGVSFLFPGDMERAGFDNMLKTNTRFRAVVGGLDVLMASHHGRESGICPDMFDVWGCRPKLVVISDDYKQYDTQETVNHYASQCSGIVDFRYSGNTRKVLTTRNDGEIRFSFANGNCWAT
jgi:beta-lactamase superfamily II metal-dependent hydrolase